MSSKLIPTQLSSLKVSRHQIPACGFNPNTSIQNRPLLIYHSAFQPSSVSASALESHVSSTGVVVPQWRYTMFSDSHFHSNTHEVLCIASGKAKCLFGHEDNQGKVIAELTKGDVVILPAGVAHRLWEDIEGGFQMVGCYPKGYSWDMCYGKKSEKDKIDKIKDLEWFKRDPIYGDEGPSLDA